MANGELVNERFLDLERNRELCKISQGLENAAQVYSTSDARQSSQLNDLLLKYLTPAS